MGRKGKGSRKLELAQADVHLQGGAHSGARASVSPLEGVHLIRYDTAAFPFYRAFQALALEGAGAGAGEQRERPPLALLHEQAHWPVHTPACPQYADGLVLNGIKLLARPQLQPDPPGGGKIMDKGAPKKLANRARAAAAAAFHSSAAYAEFLEIYDALMRRVIAPLLALPSSSSSSPSASAQSAAAAAAAAAGGRSTASATAAPLPERALPFPARAPAAAPTPAPVPAPALAPAPASAEHDERRRAVVCQRPPTLRFQLGGCPGRRTAGRLHCDAEYDPTQAFELNVWLPITPVSGEAGNTLLVESAPGRGDYTPIDAVYGECALFWGHRCRHYTTPNLSGTTRVSFDARCVPAELFVGGWGGAAAARSSRDGASLGHGEWRRYNSERETQREQSSGDLAGELEETDAESLAVIREAVLHHYEALGAKEALSCQ